MCLASAALAKEGPPWSNPTTLPSSMCCAVQPGQGFTSAQMRVAAGVSILPRRYPEYGIQAFLLTVFHMWLLSLLDSEPPIA